MGILIAAFILLFLLLLLSMPLIVEARARVGLRGAAIRARIYLFGLIPITLKLRLHLFSTPYFTLEIGKKRVFLLQNKRKGGGFPPGVRIVRLDAKTTVGIRDEPAAAVLSAGTISVLLSMLIPRAAEGGSACAAVAERPMLRITLAGQAIVFPFTLLAGLLRSRRIARRKAANNSRKTNEKRINHAPC